MNLLNPIAAHLLPLVRAQNGRLYGTPNDVPSGSYCDARDRAGREAGAFEAMKTVDAAAVATLVAPATADEIVRMAFKAQRVDVVVVALPHLNDTSAVRMLDVQWITSTGMDAFEDVTFIDALLARLGPAGLNSTIRGKRKSSASSTLPSAEFKAAWEVFLRIPGWSTDEDRCLTVLLPKLHAAGADVMADRFQAGDAAIASGPKRQVMDLPAGRRALATYRRQTLVTELSAIVDAVAPAPDQPRARRRL